MTLRASAGCAAIVVPRIKLAQNAAIDVHHRPNHKRATVKAQILRFAWPALGLRVKRTGPAKRG